MSDALTVGSLFAGIGGFDLGFERAGLRTVWLCEQDPFCQHVLSERWPGVPVYDDVRLLSHAHGGGLEVDAQLDREAPQDTSHGGSYRAHVDGHGDATGAERVPVQVPQVDVLCGGFPCQDISLAGKGAGIEGARSGLWSEFARLVGELRPRYVVVENVRALRSRGLHRVVGDLAELGYDAEWDVVRASDVGAPHQRARLWIVAYPHGNSRESRRIGHSDEGARGWHGDRSGVSAHDLADANDTGCEQRRGAESVPPQLATAERGREGGRRIFRAEGWPVADAHSEAGGVEGSAGEALPRPEALERSGRRGGSDGFSWPAEPDVGRVAHGVPARVDRLRALGNALVPQIAQWIGEQIVRDAQ